MSRCTDPRPVNGVHLQLYSIRDAMKKDPVATIEKVGAMGYDFVESAHMEWILLNLKTWLRRTE